MIPEWKTSIEALTKPWTYRIPEQEQPIPLEGAIEYRDLAEFSFRESDEAFAVELAEKIPQGSEAVDIGSGPGFQAIYLAKMRPDIKIHLVDYSTDMLSVSMEKGRDYRVDNQLVPHLGDMTRLSELMLPPNLFVFSNTAIHELPKDSDLPETLRGIGEIAGNNGIFIRDLIRPANELQAEEWRRQILGDTLLPERGLRLFRNSQRAGFSQLEVQNSLTGTSLENLGEVNHLVVPNSRYWTFEVKLQ